MAQDDENSGSAFNSIEQDQQALAPPVGRFAIMSLLFGLASLIVVIAPSLNFLCFAAIGCGIVGWSLLARSPSKLNSRCATLGTALGILTLVWGTIAVRNENNYLYQEGAKHAVRFLEVLGEGKKYEALELTQIELDRQITGTNLKVYYDGLKEDYAERPKIFFNNRFVKSVIAAGTDANWEYVRPIEIERKRSGHLMLLEFRSLKYPKIPPTQIRIQRAVGLVSGEKRYSTALWNVVEFVDPASSR